MNYHQGFMCRNKDSSLAETAIRTFIEKPLEFGWDKENDGIFYFLDADGEECNEIVHMKINYFRSLSHSSGVGHEVVVGSS